MARQLASILFAFDPCGALSVARIQERLVADDGEGGYLSRDLEPRAIDPEKDAAALARILGNLGCQQQTTIKALEAKVADLEAAQSKVAEALAEG